MPTHEALVRDIMRKPVFTIASEAGLDRAMLIMRQQRIRHLPVVEDGKLVGMISDRDLRLSMEELEQGPSHAPKGYFLPALTKVKTAMVTSVMVAVPDMPLIRAATLMSEKKFGCLPVVDEERRPVGIVTETDMLRLLVRILKDHKDKS
jgi:acetoin utilization protein AcuB